MIISGLNGRHLGFLTSAWVGLYRSVTTAKTDPKNMIFEFGISLLSYLQTELWVFPVWTAAISDFSLMLRSNIVRSIAIRKHDPKNMVFAFVLSLISCLQAELWIFSVYAADIWNYDCRYPSGNILNNWLTLTTQIPNYSFLNFVPISSTNRYTEGGCKTTPWFSFSWKYLRAHIGRSYQGHLGHGPSRFLSGWATFGPT